VSYSEQRSPEREQKYDEPVCGVTFAELATAAYSLIQNESFWPSHLLVDYPSFKPKDIFQSDLACLLVDLTAFACLNLLRKRHGMEPLTDVHPLARLAEVAEGKDGHAHPSGHGTDDQEAGDDLQAG
jgi:hypothetical protein